MVIIAVHAELQSASKFTLAKNCEGCYLEHVVDSNARAKGMSFSPESLYESHTARLSPPKQAATLPVLSHAV